MAIVVSATVLERKFRELEWGGNLSPEVILAWLTQNSVTGAEFVAYLNALLANPDGVDDQAIGSCPAAKASKITGVLASKKLVV
jgi:hypothetical protein